MSEETPPVDIQHIAEVHRDDSTRRFVSTPLPHSCQIGQTNIDSNNGIKTNQNTGITLLANAVNIDLSKYLNQMHCNPSTSEIVNNTNSKVETICDLNVLPKRKQNVKQPVLNHTSNTHALPNEKATNKLMLESGKRKRDSPLKRNVREKLLQYAYKDKSTKNVTFDLQADADATNNVDMEERVSASSSAASTSSLTAVQERSYETLETALPQRRSRPVHRHIQHTVNVQTLPTEDEMRKYQVPDSMETIWKLYEQRLRTVGRAQARIAQLTSNIQAGNPPSWCFGGTQAPLYMRPYHPELVAVSLEYAMKMAITARNIIIRQTESDAMQARHLQETLLRMYKQENDPNFELATGRAEGIAAHYNRKEVALNIRQTEEDQQNIPTETEEWAEILCRRKVTKASARSRSRSNSKEAKKKAQKTSHANKTTPKQPKKSVPSTSTQPPSTSNNNKKKTTSHQQNQSYQEWKASKAEAQNQAPRHSSSNTSNLPRPSSSNTHVRGGYVPQPRTQQQSSAAGTNNQRQTQLNEEELRLITLLRASKNV